MKTTVSLSEHIKSTSIVVFILAVITLLALLTSCESQSGKLASVPLEKVVIVDSNPFKVNGQFHYKVRRSNGTVTWIYNINSYMKGDTILQRIIHQ